MKLKIIAAIANNNVIGTKEGVIPWDFHPDDMKIFSNKTKSEGGVVVMGRKTFLSLPEKFRPLPNRKNIVLTRNTDWRYTDVEVFNDKESLFSYLRNEKIETLWVCGGADIYVQFLDLAYELHISHFDSNPGRGVAFFPCINYDIWEEVESKMHLSYAKSPSFIHKVYKKRKDTHMV